MLAPGGLAFGRRLKLLHFMQFVWAPWMVSSSTLLAAPVGVELHDYWDLLCTVLELERASKRGQNPYGHHDGDNEEATTVRALRLQLPKSYPWPLGAHKAGFGESFGFK